jgi:hypothetical protein
MQSKQTTITDFNMPLGLELDKTNRWVIESAMIPWDDIEIKYAALFNDSKTGNVAYPLRLALGALLIKAKLNYSDVELAHQIQENPYLQYFCGLPGYTNELPFDPSTVTHFRKRLTRDILGEINELTIANTIRIIEENRAKNPQTKCKDKNNDSPPSDTTSFDDKETLLLDSTCVPQNIRFPLDLSLLNESREKLEKMIDKLHEKAGGKKPRTYRKKARKLYLKTAKKKKKSAKEIRKAIRQQLGFVARDIKHLKRYFEKDFGLPPRQQTDYHVICKLYEQQKYMYDNRVHKVKNRIVSIKQYWVRPIVRGKARTKVEFGSKIDISVHRGFVRLGHTSFEPYNESENFINECNNFFARENHYPKRVLVDEIHRTRNNLAFSNKHTIETLGKPLGRPKQVIVQDKKHVRKSEIDRIEVERKISLAKGSFSMALLRTKLMNTSFTMISISILAMNIAYAVRVIFVFYFLSVNLVQKIINSILELKNKIWCNLMVGKMMLIQ